VQSGFSEEVMRKQKPEARSMIQSDLIALGIARRTNGRSAKKAPQGLRGFS
jgi:hypothetical protein